MKIGDHVEILINSDPKQPLWLMGEFGIIETIEKDENRNTVCGVKLRDKKIYPTYDFDLREK